MQGHFWKIQKIQKTLHALMNFQGKYGILKTGEESFSILIILIDL